MKGAGVPFEALLWETFEVRKKREEAREQFRKCCRDADLFRTDHLETLAAAKAKDKGTTKAGELRMLKSSNKAREIGRNVRTALGKNSKGLATSLQRPHPTGEGMEICDTQTSLVDASIDEATARFTRATDISPFMTDPLLSEVGPMAELPGADEILAGTFECPPETDQYTQLLIQHLATPPEVMAAGDIPLDIPLKEHQRAWKQQNHHTAADPRNLSFAHHKAGAHN
ncbi:expressed unknown protein [Seminavis robusta]|uniref:Uncharacterized protein n=1 Tax=Seminavis robusta TaxID=568900 RepID=A0A9N8HXR5_9STRA|nr:expressed unknown protein [Seminavis robusta]|eukprot:Sro3292_g346290.1 n/a (228) ;mRNA; f:6687-7370